jgi:hypothetical protein
MTRPGKQALVGACFAGLIAVIAARRRRAERFGRRAWR